MQKAEVGKLALIGASLLLSVGFVKVATPTSLPCVVIDTTSLTGPTVIADFADGLSSDGRGPYVKGSDGVITSAVNNAATLTMYSKAGVKTTRTYTVNMDNPVPGGGGVPLGIITDTEMFGGGGLMAQLLSPGDTLQNLHSIPVGQKVAAPQIFAAFRVQGRFHVLQFGPQPNGHCHGPTLINGVGTTTGTILRVSRTKWAVDLPAKSVGRLFDVNDSKPELAVDKGLYYVRLHFEIGQ